MATVKEIFGEMPRMQFDLNSLTSLKVDPEKIWANYDEETDSMIMYITGGPVRSIAVALGDNIYVMVDPATNKVVGLQFEAWDKEFMPEFEEANKTWHEVKPTLALGWSYTLRTFMLWLVAVLQQHPQDKRMLLETG